MTRIRGRLAHSPSGAAVARERAGPAAARAPGDRLAALLVEIAPLGPGAFAGHVRGVALVAHVGPWTYSAVDGGSGRSPSSMSVALPGRRLARDADRSPVAFLEPPGRASGDRPVARRPLQELQDEGRHDRRDRDAEDGARDARDAPADEHRAQDDDRVDADGALHDPRLEDVHDEQPAGAHQDDRRDDRVGLAGRARR